MRNIIKNLLINNARKSMLESVDGIDDIDFLKKELKKSLRKEFDLQQRIDKAIEYIENNKIYAEIEDYGKSGNDYVKIDDLLSILKGEDK